MDFKIPLKIPSKPQTEIDELNSNSDPADTTKGQNEYTSPLQLIDTALAKANLNELNTSTDDESASRKRKQTPSSTDGAPESMRPVLPLYGRNKDYPDALNNLIKPLHCDLCGVQLTGRMVAHDHYDSRKHISKVNNWLSKWSSDTGETAPKVLKVYSCLTINYYRWFLIQGAYSVGFKVEAKELYRMPK